MPTREETLLSSGDPRTERWFAEEVHAHDAALKAYLRTAYPRMRDIDDVVQESYLRIWKARFAQRIHFTKSYLFQIARNLSLDLVRRDRASPIEEVAESVAQSVCDPAPPVVDQACARDDLRMLAGAIDALPGRCREIMILRQIEGVSQKDIAARLGISVLTVQVQVVRGLRRIDLYLRRHGVKRPGP
jgi:RNA polymerase sigma factor (sigma-70 family)